MPQLYDMGHRNEYCVTDIMSVQQFLPLGLGATNLSLPRNTSSHDGQHFCQVISKSIQERQSYGPDMKNRTYFLPLTSKYYLDLGATDLGFARNTSSHDGQHFCQVISKSIEEWRRYRLDTKKRPYF